MIFRINGDKYEYVSPAGVVGWELHARRFPAQYVHVCPD